MAAMNEYQQFVFTDPKALSLFEGDEFTTVLSRHEELFGYQTYIVEQWACSRERASSIITTFSGNSEHRIVVSVIKVPVSPERWTPRLQAYVASISTHQARRKLTSHGYLFVTNLSEFPSNLRVILIPCEDTESHADRFILNENLKRMGCSGRAGLSLAPPTGATQAKFRQLYHVSDRIAVKEAAVELVKLCQVALVLFKQLSRELTDGFLCDKTATAAKAWWAEIGTYYFNIEPNDGPLGPTTVSALLGLLLGARKRLSYCSAPVAKDAFNLKAMKRGIEHFQKWNKLERSRRLDRHTLHRLHRSTSKFATSEGWAMPKAVKSTVAEIGKGGEMVVGMVGTRGRSSIAEVESLDIRGFAAAASGEHCKWLWRGKPRKSNTIYWPDMFTSEDDTASSDEGHMLVSKRKKRDSLASAAPRYVGDGIKGLADDKVVGSQVSLATQEKEQVLRKTVLKNMTERMTDAKSGLGKFKDAVAMPSFRVQSNRVQTSSDSLENIEAEEYEDSTDADIENAESRDSPLDQEPKQAVVRLDARNDVSAVPRADELQQLSAIKDIPPTRSLHPEPLTLKYADITHLDTTHSSTWLLRSASASFVEDRLDGHRSSVAKCSRRLSDSHVPRWQGSERDEGLIEILNHSVSKAGHVGHSHVARLISQITKTQNHNWTVTQDNLKILQALDSRMNVDINMYEHRHMQAIGECKDIRKLTMDRVTNEKMPLHEIMTRVDGLIAKLDYELGGLESKVDDVEDAVAEYQDQIVAIEERTQEPDTAEVVEESRWRRLLRILPMT